MKNKKWRTVTEADVDCLRRELEALTAASAQQEAQGLAASRRADELVAAGSIAEAEQLLVTEYTRLKLAMASTAARLEIAAWKVLGERCRRGEDGAAFCKRMATITGDVETLLQTLHRNRIRIADEEST